MVDVDVRPEHPERSRSRRPGRRPRWPVVLLAVTLGVTGSFAVLAGQDSEWRLSFSDDFKTDAARGTFADSSYAQRWGVYPDGWRDTSKAGSYQPTEVVSVQDGTLDLWLRTTAAGPSSAALVPHLKTYGQVYGRYSVRFRADAVEGYKLSFLLWPDSERWPDDGEVNFPEGYLTGSIGAFAHHADPSGTQDQFTTDEVFTPWHVATTEWTPGSLRFYLDGELIGRSRTAVPTTSMHWVLQTETATDEPPPVAAEGHVQVDWVRAWSYHG